jgi:hypothetical protein
MNIEATNAFPTNYPESSIVLEILRIATDERTGQMDARSTADSATQLQQFISSTVQATAAAGRAYRFRQPPDRAVRKVSALLILRSK